MIAGVIGVVLVLIKTNQTERQQIFTARKTMINWQAIIGVILILFVFQLGAELFGAIVEAGLNSLGFSALAEMQAKPEFARLVAYRYGLKWAIVTHIINNLGLSIGLQLLSQKIVWIPFLTVGLAIIGLIGFILVGMRPLINWWRQNRIQDHFLAITLRQLPILIILAYGIALALGGIQHR